MSILHKFVPNNKTRVKITIACLAANFLIAAYGVHKGTDMSDLGTGLAMLNGPLYIYILGESIRPSKVENIKHEDK